MRPRKEYTPLYFIADNEERYILIDDVCNSRSRRLLIEAAVVRMTWTHDDIEPDELAAVYASGQARAAYAGALQAGGYRLEVVRAHMSGVWVFVFVRKIAPARPISDEVASTEHFDERIAICRKIDKLEVLLNDAFT